MKQGQCTMEDARTGTRGHIPLQLDRKCHHQRHWRDDGLRPVPAGDKSE